MWAEVVANKAKSAEAEPPRPPRSRAQSARDWAARLHIAARAAEKLSRPVDRGVSGDLCFG
jgi:hypothetical protein